MIKIHHKSDAEFIHEIEKKYKKRAKKNKIFKYISYINGQLMLLFLLFMQIYSVKRIGSVYMPNDIIFFTGLSFAISILILFFLNVAHVILIIKRIFGDRTEILLLKYYDLWNNNIKDGK